ncbi:MAG: CDP-glycerol glycerophosphotransferase family protein [Clostridia bacterium]|nr:CDP-glycerol glycerophosphotransferase family protein [Clostridia bacterium]
MSLILRILKRFFWILCKLLPVKGNKIVFQYYYGRGYCDNPKYIGEEIIKYAKDLNLDLVWVLKEGTKNDLPPEFRTVTFRSFRYIYEMSTAKVWVDNSRKEYCMKKKNQYYMHTWHGGMTMKKVENMVPDKLGSQYLRMAKRDAKQCDVMLSNSRTMTKDFRKYFWYPEGEIIEKGLPRNDRLVNFTEEDSKKLRKTFNIEDDVKLLLYAPTFRNDHSLDAYNIDYKRCVEALEKRFGGKWKVLLRLHPNVFKLSDNLEFDPEIVINTSHYPDMQEIYMIADMVITDYSSVIFDYLIIGGPSLLYASDLEKYRKERDCYFDFAELPFELCQNNDELEQAILNFDIESFNKKASEFIELHGLCDTGIASKAAADWIINKVKGQ